MKANVLMPFVDLKTGEEFLPGSTYDGNDARIDDLAAYGLVERPPKAGKPAQAAKPSGKSQARRKAIGRE